MKLLTGLVTSLLVLSACGGQSTKEQTSTPTKPWKDQDHGERMITMKNVVYPSMKAEFTAFDRKEFGDMTCATCHGPGAKDKSFTMPNPKLPKLPTTEAGFEKLKKEQPEMVHFMTATVVPKMALFVGEKPYDPKKREGFSCFRCHPQDSNVGN